MTTRILVGDCRERMAELDASSIDACVTDPPYELGFMGKSWDRSGIAFDPETWAACLRVLKPGGHLLAFGGTRTVHRIACAIEEAGFEIRDQIAWIFGSGFPKSRNLDGEWDGWGTALKPAMEPIIVARKPFRGTVAANVAEHGTGALNIDGCRIAYDADDPRLEWQRKYGGRNYGDADNQVYAPMQSVTSPGNVGGRWPANVVLDEVAAELLDEQSGERPAGSPKSGNEPHAAAFSGNLYGAAAKTGRAWEGFQDTGGASRFMYCAKADRAERNIGLAGMPERKPHPDEPNGRVWDIPGSHSTPRANHHPTVKPIALMQWLVRLVTPPGGLVLDPFLGSGTTGIACDREGFNFIGIELSPEYAEISRRRLTGDAPLFADVTIETASRAGYIDSEVA